MSAAHFVVGAKCFTPHFHFTSFSGRKQMQALIPMFHTASLTHRVINCPIQGSWLQSQTKKQRLPLFYYKTPKILVF